MRRPLSPILAVLVLLTGMFVPPAEAVPAPAPLQAAVADAGFQIIADFEGGIPAGFVAFADSWDGSGSNTTMALSAEEIETPILPAEPANQAARIDFDIAASGGWGGGPGYGGITHDFSAVQDWSEYPAFSMLLYGANTGQQVQVELKSDGASPANSNRYVAGFMDDFTGWKLVVLPFADFVKRTDYNPGPNPDAPLNLMRMWGYSLLLPSAASGTVYLDHVALTGYQTVADFDAGVPAGFVPFADSWDGSGSSTTLVMDLAANDLPLIPPAAGSQAISVTYDVAASGSWGGGPGYAGVTQFYDTPQDWSDYQSFSLWVSGGGSGAELRVELKTDGPSEAASNRFVYSFVDDFTGWKLLNLPWSVFASRTDYNPGPDPSAPLNPQRVWGYSILIPGGAAGTFMLDGVGLFGAAPSDLVKIAFAEPVFTVPEGDTAVITVRLNQPAAEPVSVVYATADGTAKAGEDYTAAGGTLEFQPGELEQTFTVESLADDAVESNETVLLALSDPGGGAVLGAQADAVLRIIDDDVAAPQEGDPFTSIVDDFERGLPYATDSFGNGIGFVTWGSANNTFLETVAADASLAYPGMADPNTLLKIDFDIASGGWGGFTHAFESPDGSEWVSQDWSSFEGISFWMYGSGSGGIVNIDIFDNRTTSGDSCERYTYLFNDDFTGWKFFQIPFAAFTRKDWQPGGAPNDGLTLTEVWGYAFGFPVDAGPRTMYLDNVGLMVRHTMVDDFETGLPYATDSFGNGVGFVTWGSATNTFLSDPLLTDPADPLTYPNMPVPNHLLQVDFDIAAGGWGGFTHAFESEDGAVWVSQDWSTYEGLAFWLYGSGSGGIVNIDIFDNRTTSGDSCERFTYIFQDDFTGWKFFRLPFDAFTRKDWQPGGAPNDGLTLTEVWGYAFGFPVNAGARTIYIDSVELYGKTGGPAPQPPEIVFATYGYNVGEGQTATVEVRLVSPVEEPVTVDYATVDGTARAGYDYQPAAGTLTFAPGELLQSFEVVTLEDSLYEGRETVTLVLSNPVGAPLGNNRRIELAIIDNDPYDPALLETFEQPTALSRYRISGAVNASLAEARPGDPLELPGQDPINTYLSLAVETPKQAKQLYGVPGIERTFAQPADWSAYSGIKFWYYGTNSGKKVTVTLHDNRQPDPGPAGWTLVWSDEFDGPAGQKPDPIKWGYDIGGEGWGNAEYEYYTDSPENASMDGLGNLAIVARAIDDPEASGLDCWYGPCTHTSARLLTKDRFDFAYGRAEARLKLPYGQGIWPAFWMLGSNFTEVGWPNSGEIDIMENIGREPSTVHGTIHGPGYSGGGGIGGAYDLPEGQVFSDDFHTFAIEWEPEEIRWYVDGEHFLTLTPDQLPAGSPWVFDHPFFLIMNVAVGGYWPGYPDETTVFPQTMLVDYVRVYQAPDTSERYEYSFKDDFSGWRLIEAPFAEFKHKQREKGAPKDGLTLTEMWGYGFVFDSKLPGPYAIDQIALIPK